MKALLLLLLGTHRWAYLHTLASARRAGVPVPELTADVCALATEAGTTLGTAAR